MPRRVIRWFSCCAVLALMGGRAAMAQADKGTPPPPGGASRPEKRPEQAPTGIPDPNDLLKAAQPGIEHKALAALSGSYTTASKVTFRPGGPTQESAGTAHLAMAVDGRFLAEENGGMKMGLVYSGFRLLGYNNGTRKYEAIWTYSLSTAILFLSGTSSDGGRSIQWTGAFEAEPGKKQSLTAETRFVDADHFIVTIHGGEGSGPVEETTYTRKK